MGRALYSDGVPGVPAEAVVRIEPNGGAGVDGVVLGAVVVDERVHIHVPQLLHPGLQIQGSSNQLQTNYRGEFCYLLLLTMINKEINFSVEGFFQF